MVKQKGAVIAVVALLLVAAGAYEWRLSGQPSAITAMSAGNLEAVAQIDLQRLSAERPPVLIGKRNIFNFLPKPTPTPPPPTDTPTPVPTEKQTEPPPTPSPSPPPLPLKYIGVLEPSGKKKIAVLLSDQREILHGREGDLLAGRYRIVKIGYESIDLEDVTVGYTQRIPLRGN